MPMVVPAPRRDLFDVAAEAVARAVALWVTVRIASHAWHRETE